MGVKHVGIRIKSWIASPLGRLLICSTLYQAIWFGVVLTAVKPLFVLMGPLLVLLTGGIQFWLWPSHRSRGLKLAGAALLTGLLVDSTFTAVGVLVPYRHFMPYPLTPIWLLSLWAGFGIYIALGLERLYGRFVLAALGGLIGGPLAYRGGVPFGAMNVGNPVWAALLLVGCIWAVVFVFLIWLAGRCTTTTAPNQSSRPLPQRFLPEKRNRQYGF